MDKGSTCAIRPSARIANDTTRSIRSARQADDAQPAYVGNANRYGEKLFVGFDDNTILLPATRGPRMRATPDLTLVDWLVGLACHFPWLN
jgi:hypothetical protein